MRRWGICVLILQPGHTNEIKHEHSFFFAKTILESLPNKKKKFVLRKNFLFLLRLYLEFFYKGTKLYIHVTLLLEIAEFAKMALNFKEQLAKSTKNLYVL